MRLHFVLLVLLAPSCSGGSTSSNSMAITDPKVGDGCSIASEQRLYVNVKICNNTDAQGTISGSCMIDFGAVNDQQSHSLETSCSCKLVAPDSNTSTSASPVVPAKQCLIAKLDCGGSAACMPQSWTAYSICQSMTLSALKS